MGTIQGGFVSQIAQGEGGFRAERFQNSLGTVPIQSGFCFRSKCLFLSFFFRGYLYTRAKELSTSWDHLLDLIT